MFVQSVAHDANVGTPDAANAGTSSRQVGEAAHHTSYLDCDSREPAYVRPFSRELNMKPA